MSATATLEPWGSDDLPLLERLMCDPRMTEHLGDPESPDKLRERQRRYERLEGGDRMFKIVDAASGAGAGSVGFWTKEWRGELVYEVGWMVTPEFQGRGIAVAASMSVNFLRLFGERMPVRAPSRSSAVSSGTSRTG